MWPTSRGSVFFSADYSASTVSRAYQAGRIRKITAGVYTPDLTTDMPSLVRTNLWELVGRLIPDAVVSDRSAAENGVIDRHLYIVSNQRVTKLALPGVDVYPRQGPTDEAGDIVWAGGLRISSDARTLVDNLAASAPRHGGPARTLNRSELETWLVRKYLVRPNKDRWLSTLRSDALALCDRFAVPERIPLVEKLVGFVGRTRSEDKHVGRLLQAHVRGQAWDTERSGLFEQLAGFLRAIPEELDIPTALDSPAGDHGFDMPFFEAYFSNFIEGTEFTVEEAEAIVRSGQPAPNRPEDAHDILGTYRVVSDPVGRATPAENHSQFISNLIDRHRVVMMGRPDKRPGRFKDRPHRAGSYTFVNPELVEGTLADGFRHLETLPVGLPRALYLLFLVSEVHPFDDGNGRIARVSMCAELSAIGQSRIVVPTVWRNEYMNGLRQVSRNGRFDLFARVLAHAWRWTALMPWHDRPAVDGRMVTTNAHVDSTDAAESGVRLELP